MELTTFQSGGEGGEELAVKVAADDGGVLVEEAGSALVGGDRMDEDSGIGSSSTWPLEFRTTLWALASRSSLVARVTSMMSAATWFPVLGERGSDIFFRYSALLFAFLLITEGLFLFNDLAARGKLNLVSKENVKVEPMVSKKVKDLF